MTTISQQIQSTNVELALPATGKRTGFAFLLSLATVGTLIFSHGGRPLPFLEWTAAFLLFAIAFDLRDRRIPNLLTFPALLVALALSFYSGGGFLLRDSLLGAGLMFAILFPAFAVRALGAGDVKALMVIGALWGPSMAIPALVWMAGAGALLALGHVALRGELKDMFSRWLTSAKLTLLSRQIHYIRPEAGSAASSGIPFALAMGAGAIAFQLSLSAGSDFSW
jgi:prepilin peptidase CpaA